MIDPPAFMCGTAALYISDRYSDYVRDLLGDGEHGEDVTSESALDVLKLIRQRTDTTRRNKGLTLISVIDSSIICLLALLTKISSRPCSPICFETNFSQFLGSMISRARVMHF
jgi:hypothetical protein